MIIVCVVAGVRMQHNKPTTTTTKPTSNKSTEEEEEVKRTQATSGWWMCTTDLSLSLSRSPTIVNVANYGVAYVIVMQVSLKCIAVMQFFLLLSIAHIAMWPSI